MGWIVSSSEKICWSPNPQYFRMWTYLGVDSLQMWLVKMKSYWHTVGYLSTKYCSVFIRRQTCEDRHTGRTPCDDEGRDWSDAATNQGMPKIASKSPEARNRQERIPLQVSEGAWPYCHLSFGLLDSKNCETINFCFFKPPGLWYFVAAAQGN